MAAEHSTLQTKTCKTCFKDLLLDNFHKAANGLFGRVGSCKSCVSNAYRLRRKGNEAEQNRVILERYHARQLPKRKEKAKAEQERLGAASKVCPSCDIEKAKTEFHKSKHRKDGLRAYCIECCRQKFKKYRTDNAEKVLATIYAWQERHPERVLAKARRSNTKRMKNPIHKLHIYIGNYLRSWLKAGRKNARTFEMLGYTACDLKAHIERQFVRGMSWENYGEWHIDHILPLVGFSSDGITDADIKVAWGLPNLRPLWAKENWRKGAKRLYLL